ncbi:methyltransferase domain-containing protein [Haloplanus aerogenes]|uniref:Methyltransferase domain-containing protein n=1 Tax=Haloplanus aerogenes TaxID=660522 RepID=A0A3M0DUU8_9EURY|nr:methyltransferase domain-containing protein [Haloplanus aerogenes]AZH25879.1 methyltransferase domain-containing protein [Haloplanus aerogenes]RMB25632.1 tRNA (adenine57-N1/adenine58-N1)-methyltransferase [Haloplanus aerogenes]
MTPTFLLVHGDREYLRAPGEELQTDLGVLTVPDDAEPGDRLETHLGDEFVVRDPRGPDLFDHFERTGAPMMPRDIGLVVGFTGAAAGDRVLDAGTGTGVLAAYLGRLDADVVTYERDAEFAEVARENMRLAGVAETVDVRTGDVLESMGTLVDGPGFDILTLDTEDAPAVVRRAPDLLVSGGFVVVYSPFVEGSRAAVEAAADAGLTDVTTHETIQRRMKFDDRGSRPDTRGVGHTGYLTVARWE